jgi:hypothetical protein
MPRTSRFVVLTLVHPLRLTLAIVLQLVKGPDHVGTLIVCGQFNWDMVGKRDRPNAAPTTPQGRTLWSPHVFGPLKGIPVRVIASGDNAGWFLCIILLIFCQFKTKKLSLSLIFCYLTDIEAKLLKFL